MKLSKKIKMVLGAAICFGIFSLGTAHAGVTCEDATITKTGVYPYLPPDVAKYAVYATCSDTTKWTGELMFIVAGDDYGDSLYAAALTAASTGNTATLLVSSAGPFGTVKMLSVKTTTP